MKIHTSKKISLIIVSIFCSILFLSNTCFARRIKTDSKFTERQVAWGIIFCGDILSRAESPLTGDEKFMLKDYFEGTLDLSPVSEQLAENRNMDTDMARAIIVAAKITAKYELHMLGITSITGYLTGMNLSKAKLGITMDDTTINSDEAERILQEAKTLFNG